MLLLCSARLRRAPPIAVIYSICAYCTVEESVRFPNRCFGIGRREFMVAAGPAIRPREKISTGRLSVNCSLFRAVPFPVGDKKERVIIE